MAWVGCGDPNEAPRLDLPVVTDASGLVPVTTDQGYRVEVTQARIVLNDFAFTISGEVHTASLWDRASSWVLPKAHAHPGHSQGGEVIGELLGSFLIDLPEKSGETLGVATLLEGTYDAANFTFGRGQSDLLDASDPLIGHTAILEVQATKDNQTIQCTVVLDSPEDRVLIGAPFNAVLREGDSGQLAVRFETLDPQEGDTLFDGVDFAALDADGDGVVRIESDNPDVEDAYNTIRRTFQTHDHYTVIHKP